MDDVLGAVFLVGVRVALGAVFVVAGIAKARAGHARFLSALLGYEILRGRGAAALARALPPFEIATGAALVLGIAFPAMPTLAIAMLVMFIGALTTSLVAGRGNACGCGEGLAPVKWGLVRRDAVMLSGAIVLAIAGPGPLTLAATTSDAAAPFARLTGVALLFSLALVTRVSLSLGPRRVAAGP